MLIVSSITPSSLTKLKTLFFAFNFKPEASMLISLSPVNKGRLNLFSSSISYNGSSSSTITS